MRFIAAVLFLLPALAPYASTAHAAENYPTKPIRLIVPYAPGGGYDILARRIGQKLTERLGEPVIVDNRPGANGNIGADLVAKAPPDGYTLLMGGIGPNAINPSLYSNIPYDALKDFAPIILVATFQNVLVVNPSLPIKSVKELIVLAKAKPGQINYASAGAGSTQHLRRSC